MIGGLVIAGAIRKGGKSAKEAYMNAESMAAEETYNKIYDAAFEASEKKYHVKNNISIDIASIQEEAKLEVLRVSDVEYVIESKKDNDDGIEVWMEFYGDGVFTVDMKASEFIIDYEHQYVLVRVELLDSQLNKIEDEMTEIMKFDDSVIMTIPGIGYINGGMILGEIGDIHRFSSPGKLLAFAGLDPSVYQSGNFQARRTKMSKRGSKVLRYALINAAHNVVKNNATFKAYYDAKMAEGRTHYNALGHCAGKLVRVIWKMMTDDLEFNLD